ncbi:MAG TPA: response regulator transcription factor [Acidimicrobiales bacterium]|nr:response regulator transcription factor [Acidimicrobiales bacterium]
MTRRPLPVSASEVQGAVARPRHRRAPAPPGLVAPVGGVGGSDVMRRRFEQLGYVVRQAADAPSARRAIFESVADLVLLDPSVSGFDAGRALTDIRRGSSVPVIVLSDRDCGEERIRMLNLGADDYVAKPVSCAELEARVRAVMRRSQHGGAGPRQGRGELVVDPLARMVTLNGEEVIMTRREFDLLAFLAAAPDRVFSREELLAHVWGSSAQRQRRSTVTEHIRRVRLKIEDDGRQPRWITTVRGIGYRFHGSSGGEGPRFSQRGAVEPTTPASPYT